MKIRLFSILLIGSASYASQFEGVLGAPVNDIRNMNAYASAFVPYNAVVVEIGAFEGEGTAGLSLNFPYGQVIAFEAHPQAYKKLVLKTRSLKNVQAVNLAIAESDGPARLCGDGQAAALARSENTACIDVNAMRLDTWRELNRIKNIDVLRLDAGGLEWQILQSSPETLSRVSVIITKTHVFPSRHGILSFRILRALLEEQGFELLSHWFVDGKQGEATFVRGYMYDSIFR